MAHDWSAYTASCPWGSCNRRSGNLKETVILARPGVYLRTLQRSNKIEPYLTWLWVEGAVRGEKFARAIAVQFEVLYESAGSNRQGKHTDQVIQSQESVVLTSFILGMAQSLEPDQYTQTGWSPHAEANPWKRLSRDASG